MDTRKKHREVWEELGGWDWYTYRVDTIKEILRKTYIIAQKLCLTHCGALKGKEVQTEEETFIVVIPSLSRVWLFATPWTAAGQASLSFTVTWSLLNFMSIESVMPSSHLILCHPLLLLPSIFPIIKIFSNESVHHIRWPKYGGLGSISALPVNVQDWSPLGWTGLISLQSKGLSRVFSNTTVQKDQFFGTQPCLYIDR